MRPLRPVPALLLLLAAPACAGKLDDTDTAPPLALDDTGETGSTCSGAAPVITEVSLTDGGLYDFEGTELPSALLTVTATDADNDLDVMSADWWWETPADGTVVTERTPDIDGAPTQTRDLECGVSSATLYVHVPIQDGGYLDPETEYEVAAIVTDAHGLVSEKAIGTGVTPALAADTGGS